MPSMLWGYHLAVFGPNMELGRRGVVTLMSGTSTRCCKGVRGAKGVFLLRSGDIERDFPEGGADFSDLGGFLANFNFSFGKLQTNRYYQVTKQDKSLPPLI